jgi:hypothetical protein
MVFFDQNAEQPGKKSEISEKSLRSARLLTRKPVKKTCEGRFSDLPHHPAAFPFILNSGVRLPVTMPLKAGVYSSGHCPGFTPGSLLSPDFKLEKRGAVTKTKLIP